MVSFPCIVGHAKQIIIMTSSNRNSYRVTGPLWGGSTGHRWFPLAKASFLLTAPEQTAEQTIETLVIWDAIVLIMTSPNEIW